MLRTVVLAALAAGLVTSSRAAETPWGSAQLVTVDMASYRFAPTALMLRQGQAYVLQFRNVAGKSHNFVAKDFFRTSTVAPEDRGKIRNGAVNLPGGGTTTVKLIPTRRGTFGSYCSHFLHSTFGMKGTVTVS